MKLDDHTQSLLLLTCRFSDAGASAHRPLTIREWGTLAYWLHSHGHKPEDLFECSPSQILDGINDKKITAERVDALLNRGSALAMAAEKWARSGIWVLPRSNPDYPSLLKARLGAGRPPVLFGSGKQQLLSIPAIGVVGSRKAPAEDLSYTRDLGKAIAGASKSVVSGGAKGVDEASMLGALEAEGTCIGVLADSLMRQSTSAKYRKHLMDGNLVLISPFNPEAGFNVGNAMQRNKFIYCLSEAAIVVHSGTSGGTWEGAHENLKQEWVPLWVKTGGKTAEGNQALVRAGGKPLTGSPDQIDIESLCNPEAPAPTTDSLFGSTEIQEENVAYSEDQTAEETESLANLQEEPASETPEAEEAPPLPSSPPESLYEAFIRLAEEKCQEPVTPDEMAEALEVNKTQLNAWLKRATAEGLVTKSTRPVRYEWVTTQQNDMFSKT